MIVGEFRERALSNSERELENTVLLLARHFDQQFEDSDIVADRSDRAECNCRGSPRRRCSASRMSGLGRAPDAEIARSAPCPISATSTIYDVGRRADQLVARLAAAADQHRRRATTFRRSNRIRDVEPVMLEPVRSFLTGKLDHGHCPPAERAGRYFPRRDGAADRSCQFRELSSPRSLLAEGAAISMFHREGTMLARYPHVDSMIGQKLQESAADAEGAGPTAAGTRCASKVPSTARTGSDRPPR